MIHPHFQRGLEAFILVLVAYFCFLTRHKITKITDNKMRSKVRSLLHGHQVPRVQAQAFDRTGWWTVGAMFCWDLTH